MLETKELCKIYKPKKGIAVTALNKVSIKFPEKGMVFLLGKSGSGKSTLLNLLGGLDSYSSGDILIKGESTGGFIQKQFDSYRNTYIGFIFQEYNILDEFTVGANIALAIELQNRRASDDEINSILAKVDLAGYGSRKPNELSGGQKQRVAIARALVKNPEIIMADEPTGALDSATGRQVLDTLKKLSADKLVIIVSHDRDFAESYADRIIEFEDGRVISDVSRSECENTVCENEITFCESCIKLPPRYRLTEQDREKINAYLENSDTGAELIVSADSRTRKFIPTDASAILWKESGGMKLIKSKLPVKSAFKIGASGLKYKKVRLVMTILLSCIAFGLFGLSDTFGAYNHIKTCTSSIIDTGVKSAAIEKQKQTVENNYWYGYNFRLSENDLADFYNKTGVEMHGVYMPKGEDLDYGGLLAPDENSVAQEYNLYQTDFMGYTEINIEILNRNKLKLLAGALPDGSKNEVAVSEYVFSVFKKYGILDENGKKENINGYSDIIGKTLDISGNSFKITAVIDTDFNFSRYSSLIATEENEQYSNAEEILRYALFNEFCTTVNYSYTKLLMVGEGYVDRIIAEAPAVYPIVSGYIYFENISDEFYWGFDPENFTTLNRLPKQEILWVNGEKNVLNDNELIISSDQLVSEYETLSDEELLERVKKMPSLEVTANQPYSEDENLWHYNESGQKIVGILKVNESNPGYSSTIVVSEKRFNAFCGDSAAPYSFAVGKMPETKDEIEKLVTACYEENNHTRMPLQNSVTYELDSVNDVLKVLSKWFLYIGIGFACFAALMLANFIATSISHKKQEIGILRAIGSRGNDVFRIFFSESLIIAAINFILSAAGVFAATFIINSLLRNRIGILITVLSFGIRQILLLAAVSAAVALIASYLPVKRIASKKPIDAIRDR